MTPQDIKALRQELGCTARELARTLEVESQLVVSWEAGTQFPTKRAVLKMAALRQRKESAAAAPAPTREPARAAIETPNRPAGTSALEDPRLWKVVQRLVDDPAFLDRVIALANAPAPER